MNAPRPDRERFAAKLRRLRDLNGKMTQEELARASWVDVRLICNYEQEKSLAKDDVILRLARTLNVSPATFKACSLQNIRLLPEDAQVRIAAQLLFQISGAYDLAPVVIGDMAGVSGNRGYIEYALIEWARLIEADKKDTAVALSEGIKPDSYRAIQDRMVSTFAELNRFELGYNEPWEGSDRHVVSTPSIGDTLKRLRKVQGFSQMALAEKAGISLFSVRAYEQGKRIPVDEQREALAGALKVPVEVLSDFGIENPNTAWHFLMELSQIYSLRPVCDGDVIALVHVGHKKPLNPFFREWAEKWDVYAVSGNDVSYEYWKDHYEG